ncbi:MAG: serine hydrolase [Chitinophagaceae bacterium]|nr:serine hydrolase [Chitinophagaceae bacterium]
MLKKSFSLLLLIGGFVSSFGQELKTPAFVSDSLDQYVDRALKDWKIPGVSVAIVQNGKVVLMKGFGVKEVGSTNKVDESTLFMIGSNTKAFTATALAMLHAEKKLSLDDKVQKWLPNFKLYDPWVAKEANIRDLLSHRLGFETFQGDFMFFDSDLTKEQVFEKFSKVKPVYSFRSKWGYTNAAFAVAGEVVKAASGQTWAEFLREKIFQPLQMNSTLAISAELASAANKASAHTLVNGEIRKIAYGKIDNIGPAGSISSSAKDLTNWVLVQLNNGKLGDKQVIPLVAQQQTWLPHSILGNGGTLYNKGHFALYGLGWFIEEYSGRKIVSHTGGVNGFVTSVTLVPEEKLGIIVLTNTDQNSFYESLKWEILDSYLGNTYRDYSKTHRGFQSGQEKQQAAWLTKKQDTVKMKQAPALPLAAFTGEYNHEVYGSMNIKLENEKLLARFQHHSGVFATLEPLGGNRFLSTYNMALYGTKVFPFTIENGKVKSVTVTVEDFVEFLPYEFVKTK